MTMLRHCTWVINRLYLLCHIHRLRISTMMYSCTYDLLLRRWLLCCWLWLEMLLRLSLELRILLIRHNHTVITLLLITQLNLLRCSISGSLRERTSSRCTNLLLRYCTKLLIINETIHRGLWDHLLLLTHWVNSICTLHIRILHLLHHHHLCLLHCHLWVLLIHHHELRILLNNHHDLLWIDLWLLHCHHWILLLKSKLLRLLRNHLHWLLHELLHTVSRKLLNALLWHHALHRELLLLVHVNGSII